MLDEHFILQADSAKSDQPGCLGLDVVNSLTGKPSARFAADTVAVGVQAVGVDSRIVNGDRRLRGREVAAVQGVAR